jgi:hypothetical protein
VFGEAYRGHASPHYAVTRQCVLETERVAQRGQSKQTSTYTQHLFERSVGMINIYKTTRKLLVVAQSVSCQYVRNGEFVYEHDSCRVVHNSDDTFQIYVYLQQYRFTPMHWLFRLSRPNAGFLIRNPSYPCGWAVQSYVWGSCQPMSVWPGRLGRLVHAVIKTFSVSAATTSCVVSCFCCTRIPSVICCMSFWKLIRRCELRLFGVHAWKDPS